MLFPPPPPFAQSQEPHHYAWKMDENVSFYNISLNFSAKNHYWEQSELRLFSQEKFESSGVIFNIFGNAKISMRQFGWFPKAVRKENVSDNGSKKRKVPFSHTQTSSPCAATKLRFSQKVWVVCIDGCWWYIVADPNVWTWKCFLELWEVLSKIDKESGELASSLLAAKWTGFKEAF